MRIWLDKVHRRAERACFETSARDNIGVSIMVEWIVSAADRAYPAVEKAKKKTFDRFSAPIEASDEHLREFLASTGNLPFDQLDDKLTARDK